MKNNKFKTILAVLPLLSLLISLQAFAGISAVICGDKASDPAAASENLNVKTIFAYGLTVKTASETTLLNGVLMGVENFQIIALKSGEYQACGVVKAGN